MLALEAKEKLLKDLDKTVLKAAVGKSLLNGVKILAGDLNGVKILAGELKSNQICGRLLALEQIDRYLDSLILASIMITSWLSHLLI